MPFPNLRIEIVTADTCEQVACGPLVPNGVTRQRGDGTLQVWSILHRPHSSTERTAISAIASATVDRKPGPMSAIWDLADNPITPAFVHYRSNSGHWSVLALNG